MDVVPWEKFIFNFYCVAQVQLYFHLVEETTVFQVKQRQHAITQ